MICSKVVERYSKRYPEIVRQSLKIPDYRYLNNCLQPKRLDQYLGWRRWDSKYIEHPITAALLSHALSFPLTLACNARLFMPRGRLQTDSREIKLCCVGSRAEGTLPDEYWREFLIAANLFLQEPLYQDQDHSHEKIQIHWSIDFIGPEVSKRGQSHTISIDDMENLSSRKILFHNHLKISYHSYYLHDFIYNHSHPNTRKDLNAWDGVVLFNPGCGHSNLIENWKPSIDLIMKSNCSVILTAHSSEDGKRDLAMLIQSISKCNKGILKQLKYLENPFASRMIYEDKLHDNNEDAGIHFVRPNHSMILIDRVQVNSFRSR